MDNAQKIKQNDDQQETLTIIEVKDCDAGYTMSFEGSDYSYWISSKYNFVPKVGDTARFYGELTGSIVKEKVGKTKEGKDQIVAYHKTDYAAVRGLDIVRVVVDKATKREKRQRVELFYTPAEKVKA